MFKKLEHLGFGGKILSLLRSMYRNDKIKFYVNGEYTDELYLTCGVKQGRKLSFIRAVLPTFMFQGVIFPPICLGESRFINHYCRECNNKFLTVNLLTLNA